MKQKLFALAAILITTVPVVADSWTPSPETLQHQTYEVVKGDVFYDGYYTDQILGDNVADKVIRHTNYLHEYPLDPSILCDVHYNLKLDVEIGALCDNYDRMGRVMLAFEPKDKNRDENYNGENGNRIELGRFITPFMNKNKLPDKVPYTFDLSDLAYILNDITLADTYNLWLQVEVFGVPYDANRIIRGCAGRQDVFSVNASLSWDSAIPLPTGTASGNISAEIIEHPTNSLIPVYTARTEIHGNKNLNNYDQAATDTIGVTSRTFTFEVDKDLKYSRLMLISTPHGAGENGEEYVRRTHLVYVDGELVHTFIPGGVSCEPYRQYNTQRNLIYGDQPEDDWVEWNNWCPGQAVPIRRIDLGAVKAGKHTVMIRVPEAEFYGKDGDIRPSLYLHGSTFMELTPTGVNESESEYLNVKFNRYGDTISFISETPVTEAILYSIDGRLLEGKYNPGNEFSLSGYAPGQYILLLIGENGMYKSLKVVK